MELQNKVAIITGATGGIGEIELAGTGIRVAAIAPGTVDTGLYDQWDREAKEWITSGGALQPDDIARSVRFLLEQPDSVTIARLLVVPAGQPV